MAEEHQRVSRLASFEYMEIESARSSAIGIVLCDVRRQWPQLPKAIRRGHTIRVLFGQLEYDWSEVGSSFSSDLTYKNKRNIDQAHR